MACCHDPRCPTSEPPYERKDRSLAELLVDMGMLWPQEAVSVNVEGMGSVSKHEFDTAFDAKTPLGED